MKHAGGIIIALLPILGTGCGPSASVDKHVFPNRPIKLIVYTGPGGLIDSTARKFIDVASKYTDATIVVENKPGAGGIVALKKVLQMPADGYTLFACTKSNISKIVATSGESYIPALDWIAMLMADPQCIIMRTDLEINSWADLVQDARNKQGDQIWVGPAIGGLDHVTALKVWEQVGISAKWIPYKSGNDAKAALLGDQGVAYVGNPQEADGNPNLHVVALSSPSRIAQFPDVPTFQECGIQGLDHEFMWRGFALKKGTPPEALAWYDELFRNVTDDPDWRGFWEKGGIDVVYYGSDKFTQIVNQDAEEFAHYLGQIGILRTGKNSVLANWLDGHGVAWIVAGLVLANGILAILVARFGERKRIGYFLIPTSFISVCLIFAAISLNFPTGDDIGPAAVPQLWICLLVPLNLHLFYVATRDRSPLSQRGETFDLVLKFAFLVVLYVVAIYFLGYYICSFIFLLVAMYMLGLRKVHVMLSVSAGWLLFSYYAFARLLYVPLPTGRLLERFF